MIITIAYTILALATIHTAIYQHLTRQEKSFWGQKGAIKRWAKKNRIVWPSDLKQKR